MPWDFGFAESYLFGYGLALIPALNKQQVRAGHGEISGAPGAWLHSPPLSCLESSWLCKEIPKPRILTSPQRGPQWVVMGSKFLTIPSPTPCAKMNSLVLSYCPPLFTPLSTQRARHGPRYINPLLQPSVAETMLPNLHKPSSKVG